MEVGARLSFMVDFTDPQAGVTRKYQLCYFTQDDTIEMHDIRNRRIFLKRSPYPQLSPSDLYLGASVYVHARRLHVVAYADDATQRIYAHRSARTVFLITPEGTPRMGAILSQATNAGFRIKQLNMLRISEAECAQLRAIDPSAGQWAGQPLVAVEAVGDDAPTHWRQLLSDSADVSGGTWTPAEEGLAQLVCEFFFEAPERANRSSCTLQNCALCLIKPHAVRDRQGGDIVQAILDEGFEVSALRSVHITKADAEDFLEVYKGVMSEYSAFVEQFSTSPLWAAEIRAEDAVLAFRQLCGPYDPEIAKVLAPHSLRARFGRTRSCNAVHCTDLPEDGQLECDYFFDVVKPKA
eukprot:TRINITY_DN1208_c0_g1_i1.p1 TRINITY_DN1208_c0_g1~~TRINITY_DN1208_c0_g1_i1.p1  ORF type:complete len:379 (+),score=136.50 TRINITY_DN1208_c0_g1_i1:84-1139(+)